jgi:hypothetical protein
MVFFFFFFKLNLVHGHTFEKSELLTLGMIYSHFKGWTFDFNLDTFFGKTIDQIFIEIFFPSNFASMPTVFRSSNMNCKSSIILTNFLSASKKLKAFRAYSICFHL